MRRLRRGDVLAFYSPREAMGSGTALRAFTAAGRIMDDAPYQASQSLEFQPFRRETAFWHGEQAPIQPLLDALTFTRGRAAWGLSFRRSVFRIEAHDFATIAKAMTLDLVRLPRPLR